MTVGLEVFVQDVIAAIATEPVRIVAVSPPTSISIGRYVRRSPAEAADRWRVRGRRGRSLGGVAARRRERRRIARRERLGARLVDVALRSAALDAGLVERLEAVRERRPEAVPQVGERDPILRPARPGDGRDDRRQVELEDVVEVRPGAGLAPQALLARVPLDERDPLLGCGRSGAGTTSVSSSIGKIVDVAPNSGLMLLIVARSASDRPASPSPANSTNAPTTPNDRSISVTTRTRSVAVEPCGSSPWSRTPTIRGIGW